MKPCIDIVASTSASLTSIPVTLSLADIDPANAVDNFLPWTVRVFGDVDFHVSTTGDATTGDFPIVGGFDGREIRVPRDGTVSFIKRSTAMNGTVWVSRIRYVQ